MSAPNGGPAFPYAFEHRDPPQCGFAPGMTLRDFFAANAIYMAFSDLKRADDSDTYIEVSGLKLVPGNDIYTAPEYVAAVAYEIADAMLAERAKGGTQ